MSKNQRTVLGLPILHWTLLIATSIVLTAIAIAASAAFAIYVLCPLTDTPFRGAETVRSSFVLLMASFLLLGGVFTVIKSSIRLLRRCRIWPFLTAAMTAIAILLALWLSTYLIMSAGFLFQA